MKTSLYPAKKFNNLIVACLLVVMTVMLFACSEEKTPVRTSPSALKTAPQPTTQITPTVVAPSPEAVFTYNPQGRRDPFALLISKEESKERASSRPPLERYGVSEFKLSGIVWGGFGYNAMLEGPDGKGYFVRVGTVIGVNKGIIKKITKDTMIIEEKFKNMLGEMERKQIVIQLRKKQEGMP